MCSATQEQFYPPETARRTCHSIFRGWERRPSCPPVAYSRGETRKPAKGLPELPGALTAPGRAQGSGPSSLPLGPGPLRRLRPPTANPTSWHAPQEQSRAFLCQDDLAHPWHIDQNPVETFESIFEKKEKHPTLTRLKEEKPKQPRMCSGSWVRATFQGTACTRLNSCRRLCQVCSDSALCKKDMLLAGDTSRNCPLPRSHRVTRHAGLGSGRGELVVPGGHHATRTAQGSGLFLPLRWACRKGSE